MDHAQVTVDVPADVVAGDTLTFSFLEAEGITSAGVTSCVGVPSCVGVGYTTITPATLRVK